MKHLAIAFLLIIFLGSCNSYDRREEKVTDQVQISTPYHDSSLIGADSLARSSPSELRQIIDEKTCAPLEIKSNNQQSIDNENSGKRSAVLGYSYFKNMRQHETRNISAYVSILNSLSRVIDTLREINSEIIPERKNDTASIFAQNIILYKYLDISLIDPDSDFTIKLIHDNSRQRIDSTFGNFWTWAITTKTKKNQSRLILRVIAEKPDGNKVPFQKRDIPINISLDRSIFRSIYSWLFDNPEKALVIILIPLIGFFWKRIEVLFKKKPKSE